MTAQIFLTVEGAKHLIASALAKHIDFSKRVYVAYGSTNNYFLYHLGIHTSKLYAAGCNANGKFNITKERDRPVVIEKGGLYDISGFDIQKDDVFIKGANALWYENGKKRAAVAAADPNGGTYGNYYVKAAARGTKIVIPVGHEKLIPFFVNTSQDTDFATGKKISMLEFFAGEVFTEIEAFKTLFDLDAKVILAGGIGDSKGGVGFLVEGEYVKEAVEFAEKYNGFSLKMQKSFIF
ncbi:hypothetical protein [Nautilia sp.]